MEKKFIDTDKEPNTPKGCKIIEHITLGKIDISMLFLENVENQFNKLALEILSDLYKDKKKLLLNATVLDWFLLNQKHIPISCQKEGTIFWGTIFAGDDYIFVKELVWIPTERQYNWRSINIFHNNIHHQRTACLY